MKITDTLSGNLHIFVCASVKRKFLWICGGKLFWINVQKTKYRLYSLSGILFYKCEVFWGN